MVSNFLGGKGVSMDRLDRVGRLAGWLVFAFFVPAFAFAQAGLEVTVYNHSSQEPLAGVEVLVENAQTAFTAKETTNAVGKVRFAALSTAGAYTVRVAGSDAYHEARAENLTL